MEENFKVVGWIFQQNFWGHLRGNDKQQNWLTSKDLYLTLKITVIP